MLQFEFSFTVPGKGEHLARGEFSAGLRLAILGPSGCGKTTFLKSLVSLAPRESGFVKWQGVELNKKSLQTGLLGFSFQNSPLFPHLNVRENLRLPFRTLSGFKHFSESLQLEKVQTALARAGLEHLAERWPHDLSGGEKKRISLLRSMIFSAPLLVLDEPFADLDAANRALFKEWISGVLQDHKGILIYVTHSAEDLSIANAQYQWPSGLLREIDFGVLPP